VNAAWPVIPIGGASSLAAHRVVGCITHKQSEVNSWITHRFAPFELLFAVGGVVLVKLDWVTECGAIALA
jgi:hypothetical protein